MVPPHAHAAHEVAECAANSLLKWEITRVDLVDMAAHDAPPDPRRVLRSRILTGLTLVLVAAWAWFAAPVTIGGRATYVIVSGHSMLPVLHAGSLVVTTTESEYRRGDVVVYRVADGQQAAGSRVVHRIVGGDARNGFITRGDNRRENDPWRPRPADVLGRVRVEVPFAGRAVAFILSPIGAAVLAGIVTFMLLSATPAPRPRRVVAPSSYRPQHARGRAT